MQIGFELVRDMIQVQLGQCDALDGKANFVLGSATVLISIYAAFLASQTSAQKFSLADNLFLNVPLAFIYLMTIVFAYLGYIIRDFKIVPHPKSFVSLLLHLEERQTRLSLLNALAAAYELNSRQLAKKADYVGVALTFLCIEAVFLVATLGFTAFR